MNGSLDKYAESLEHIINFVMLGVYGTAIILFGGLLLLILAARNLFHPLFCLLFSLIILVYMVCNTLSVISFCLHVSGYQGDNVYIVIGTIYQAAYIYLTCTGLGTLLLLDAAPMMKNRAETQTTCLCVRGGSALMAHFASALTPSVSAANVSFGE
ncbi:unnamed protein product [Heligmosomoides polygyrus]|uniref:MARVEL domain-containing protein n=1 Tax=Heligmosomoides polygyrus TaxID=6339 RepID=A0A183GQT2_HELPZ|nr:unnamed protein product [Heligmosomoides polygyrus]